MIKTLTFAMMHFSIAVSVVYMLTGSLAVGGLVGLIEPMCNTVAFFFHEKLWERHRARRETGGPPAMVA
ncbi:DUF2061 domain-containing protein [Arhodomonas aquaeolei]|uniref:DUF2061 domain-containing protein n=1 Tax=Arhodomonas aquaeolei TaxID=2369 RepID=UPI0003713F47|nr:DUF2061 domain-containing protein [Arhodomonas aquaeolei]